jgi:hypothetical protein
MPIATQSQKCLLKASISKQHTITKLFARSINIQATLRSILLLNVARLKIFSSPLENFLGEGECNVKHSQERGPPIVVLTGTS